jgi:hypothetical protein
MPRTNSPGCPCRQKIPCSWFCGKQLNSPVPPQAIIVTDPVYGEFTIPLVVSPIKGVPCIYMLNTTLPFTTRGSCPNFNVPVQMSIFGGENAPIFQWALGRVQAPLNIGNLLGLATTFCNFPAGSGCAEFYLQPGLGMFCPSNFTDTVNYFEFGNPPVELTFQQRLTCGNKRPWSSTINVTIEAYFGVGVYGSPIYLIYGGPCPLPGPPCFGGSITLPWTFSEA